MGGDPPWFEFVGGLNAMTNADSPLTGNWTEDEDPFVPAADGEGTWQAQRVGP